MRRIQPKFHQKCHTQSRSHKPKTRSKLAGQKIAIKGAQAKKNYTPCKMENMKNPAPSTSIPHIQNPPVEAIPHELFFHSDVSQQRRLVARISLVLRRSAPQPDGSTAPRIKFQHKMRNSTLLPCMSQTRRIWLHRFCFIVLSRHCDATCAGRYKVLKHCDAKCAGRHSVSKHCDAKCADRHSVSKHCDAKCADRHSVFQHCDAKCADRHTGTRNALTGTAFPNSVTPNALTGTVFPNTVTRNALTGTACPNTGTRNALTGTSFPNTVTPNALTGINFPNTLTRGRHHPNISFDCLQPAPKTCRPIRRSSAPGRTQSQGAHIPRTSPFQKVQARGPRHRNRGPVEPGSNNFPPPLGPDKSQSSSPHPSQSCWGFPPLTLVSHPHLCSPTRLRGQSPGLRLRRHQQYWWGHPLHQPASVRSAPPTPAYQPSPTPPIRSWGLDLAQPLMHIRSRRYRNGAAWRLPSKTVIHERPSARKRSGEKTKKKKLWRQMRWRAHRLQTLAREMRWHAQHFQTLGRQMRWQAQLFQTLWREMRSRA